MGSKQNISSLSEELSHIVNPEPTYIDPEDDIDVESSAKSIFKSKTPSQNQTDFNEYDISVLRRKRTQILSDQNKRYSGKKVDRKALEDNDDSDLEQSEHDSDQNEDGSDVEEDEQVEDEELEDEGVDEESNDSEVVEFYSDNVRAPMARIEEYDESQSNYSESDSGGESDDSNDHNEEYENEKVDSKFDEINDDEYINQFSNIDVNDEIAKGLAVKNQLLIWDNLLESRIKIQKLLVDTNKLPQFDYLPLLKKCSDPRLNESLKESSKAIKKLLNVLIDIERSLDSQSNLLSSQTHSSEPKPNYENADEEITSDEESETNDISPKLEDKVQLKRKLTDSEYPEFLSKKHCDLVSIRNDIIDKWYEKTRYTSGNFKQKSFASFEQSATKQIEQILSDMERLIKRTQTKRSLYNIIGKTNQNDETLPADEPNEQMISEDISKNNGKELDPEIFDDDDFYHQLLRELIESKTNSDTNDPIALSRKWIEIQKLRSKMKRKVDTKASKGRKVRYDVHSKLVNFMAPIDYSTYTEEAKNELFNSLFGKKLD